MTTSANQIKAHIRDLLIQHTDIVPKTTLAATAVMGTLTATIDPLLNGLSQSRIVPNSRVTFSDDLGEATLTVSTVSVDGSVLTFKTSPGTGFTGLIADHTSGTVLYANGVANLPTAAAGVMMSRGDPLLFITATQVTYPQPQAMANTIWTPVTVHIQIDRPVDVPDSTLYEPSMWAAFVEDQTNADLQTIAETLLAHEDLATDLGEGLALELGILNGNGDKVVTRAGQKPMKSGGWYWSGTATVIVTANGAAYPAY